MDFASEPTYGAYLSRDMMKTLSSLLLLFSVGLQAAPIERVISLAPHATEIAYAAGLGDKLIAVSEMSDYPEAAKTLEKVSNYKGINLEKIITLKPDLIIAWPAGNPAKELEKLEQFGFKIYYSQTKSLKAIGDNIEQLSQYSDDPQIGLNNARDYRTHLEALRAKYQNLPKTRYFYQLSDTPIITVAGQNWPTEVFRFCGGENVFGGASAPYPQVSIEQVILKRPQAMFVSPHAIQNNGMWSPWVEEIPALKNAHFWQLNSDWLNRPTPRTLLAIEQVCEHFASIEQKR